MLDKTQIVFIMICPGTEGLLSPSSVDTLWTALPSTYQCQVMLSGVHSYPYSWCANVKHFFTSLGKKIFTL